MPHLVFGESCCATETERQRIADHISLWALRKPATKYLEDIVLLPSVCAPESEAGWLAKYADSLAASTTTKYSRNP